jgi:hypothetical protein
MTGSLKDLPVETRLALLEARVRLLVLVVEGMIVAAVTALIAYFFGK